MRVRVQGAVCRAGWFTGYGLGLALGWFRGSGA